MKILWGTGTTFSERTSKMLNEKQKQYLSLYLDVWHSDKYVFSDRSGNAVASVYEEMGELYAHLTYTEQVQIEEWIDRFKRGEDVEDFIAIDKGYELGEYLENRDNQRVKYGVLEPSGE